jgi:hypothetical protein
MSAYRQSSAPEIPPSLCEPVWHRLLIVLLVASSVSWVVGLWRVLPGPLNFGVIWSGYSFSAIVVQTSTWWSYVPLRWKVVAVAWWPLVWPYLGAKRALRWIVRGT